jgi:hypothetical protein
VCKRKSEKIYDQFNRERLNIITLTASSPTLFSVEILGIICENILIAQSNSENCQIQIVVKKSQKLPKHTPQMWVIQQHFECKKFVYMSHRARQRQSLARALEME